MCSPMQLCSLCTRPMPIAFPLCCGVRPRAHEGCNLCFFNNDHVGPDGECSVCLMDCESLRVSKREIGVAMPSPSADAPPGESVYDVRIEALERALVIAKAKALEDSRRVEAARRALDRSAMQGFVQQKKRPRAIKPTHNEVLVLKVAKMAACSERWSGDLMGDVPAFREEMREAFGDIEAVVANCVEIVN